MKETISISLEKKELDYIDGLVKNGVYDSRSAVIRAFIKDTRRRKKIMVPLEDTE